MKKSVISKKGISPLIATVLLIGFTVALAAVVITWGSGFVSRVTTGTEEKSTKTITCISDVGFEIKRVICNEEGNSIISLENKGSVKINKFKLRFFADTKLKSTSDLDVSIEKYDIKEIQFQPVMPSGTNKVEVLASVIIDGVVVTCTENVKSKTFFPACP